MPDRLIVYPDADDSLSEMLTDERRARLAALGSLRIHTGAPETPREWIQRIAEADAVILGWGLPPDAMKAAAKLKVISFTGIGAGNFVDLKAAAAAGVTVTNTPGYADTTVAEHALALLLDCAKHISRLDRDTRAGGWSKSLKAMELKGKTLGLIGIGGTGATMARLARAIGMKTIAWTRNPDPARAAAAGVSFAPLHEVMAASDALSVHVALTPETTGLIDATALAAARPGVILINTARGAIVDEGALLEALRDGKVGAAGLDVFPEEPLQAGHPYTLMDNVVLTPHTAYNTPEASAAILDIAIDNLAAFYAGTPRNVVAGPGM